MDLMKDFILLWTNHKIEAFLFNVGWDQLSTSNRDTRWRSGKTVESSLLSVKLNCHPVSLGWIGQEVWLDVCKASICPLVSLDQSSQCHIRKQHILQYESALKKTVLSLETVRCQSIFYRLQKLEMKICSTQVGM